MSDSISESIVPSQPVIEIEEDEDEEGEIENESESVSEGSDSMSEDSESGDEDNRDSDQVEAVPELNGEDVEEDSSVADGQETNAEDDYVVELITNAYMLMYLLRDGLLDGNTLTQHMDLLPR